MNNVKKSKDVTMERILRWHKLGNCATACIYLAVIPFLVIFILHATKPGFEIYHEYGNFLVGVAMAAFFLRVLCAIIIKSKVWKWEHLHHNKLSDKQLIHLL